MTQTATAPLASILVRSMDRPTLARALDSAAAQTWPNVEIVVVAANGRTHRPLPGQWKGRPLRLIHAQSGQRLPRPEAANVALDAARGEWLNFLDDDDELLPGHLATLLAAPRMDERVLYSGSRMLDEDDLELPWSVARIRPVGLYFGNFTPPCAVLFHRSLVDDGARFDPAFAVYEDFDFYIALAARTRFCRVDAVTAVWHAAAGDSGCGRGANWNPALYDDYLARIREKWRAQFEVWMQNADDLLFTAESFVQSGQESLANECIERVLRLRPGDAGAHRLQAELASRRERADALLRQGQTHLKAGALNAALACFEQALALWPGDVNALNLGGVALLRAGRFVEAERTLRRAAELLPQHPGIAQNLHLARARLAGG